MAQLAIKGHPTRGNEVIEILEMLGGKEEDVYSGTEEGWVYTINRKGYIDWDCLSNKYAVYTLENFLEEFPYKVGDKVYYDNKVCDVIEMLWNINLNTISYGVCDGKIKNLAIVEELKPYKEETMESNPILQQLKEYFDNTPRNVIEKEWEELSHLNEIGPTVNEYLASVRKYRQANQYPRTYKECWKILDDIGEEEVLFDDATALEVFLFDSLLKLKRCRDAYWKIAGYLKPDWKDENETYYTISYDGLNIKCYNNTDVYSKLAFPTKEMRDAFYENFKELIEQCKELL